MRGEMHFEPESDFRLWAGIVLLGAGVGRGVASVCLPYVQRSFELDERGVILIGALVALGQLIAFFFARRADAVGFRVFHWRVVALFALSSLATGLAPNLPSFLVVQISLQACAGLLISLSAVIAFRLHHPLDRSTGQGFYQFMMVAGSGLVLLALPWVAERHWGWRAVAGAGGALVLLTLFPLHHYAKRHLEKFEIDAAPPSPELPPLRGILLPLAVSAAIITSVELPVLTYATWHAIERLGVDPLPAGRLLLLGGIVGFAIMFAAGAVADHIGAFPVLLVSVLVAPVAVHLYYGMPADASNLGFGARFALVIAAFNTAQVALRQASFSLLPARQHMPVITLVSASNALVAFVVMLGLAGLAPVLELAAMTRSLSLALVAAFAMLMVLWWKKAPGAEPNVLAG